jgi:hypothetical protein
MALSNWDTLAFDHLGQPCNGVLVGFDGGQVRIYKNWVYVSDAKMWTPGRSYVENTIAQINSGDVQMSEFSITAVRHEAQSAVFALATCRRYGENAETRCLAGIGCYGFTDPSPIIYAAAGINPDEWDDCYIGHFYHGKETGITVHYAKGEKYHSLKMPNEERFDSRWVGVLPETLNAFFAWLETQTDPKDSEPPNGEWLRTCREQGGLRFNQGDAYFASMGVDHLEATPVGQSEEPVINRVVEKLKDSMKDD